MFLCLLSSLLITIVRRLISAQSGSEVPFFFYEFGKFIRRGFWRRSFREAHDNYSPTSPRYNCVIKRAASFWPRPFPSKFNESPRPIVLLSHSPASVPYAADANAVTLTGRLEKRHTHPRAVTRGE